MEPNWQPLENRLGCARCVGFMYMGRTNGINAYKHGIARRYFFLDDHGRCYVQRESRYEPADFATELAKLEAALKQLGETLESVYDEAYIARKDAALRRAGIGIVRLQVEPQETTVN
jgi:hypothetical protein